MARIAERVAEAAGLRRDTAHRLLRHDRGDRRRAAPSTPQDDIGMRPAALPRARTGRRRRCAAPTGSCAPGAPPAMVLRGYDRDGARLERLDDELRTISRSWGWPRTSSPSPGSSTTPATWASGSRRAAPAPCSFVNHLLGIATADPVEHGLLMERFLSPTRVALPDIDIDVESARRIEVYRAIIDRFGTERVATVAMPETYRVRHAVRDVGAALGMDPVETDRLAKSFPHIRARDARTALAELPELRGIDAREYADRYGGRLWDLVEALDGLPRGVAMHPCGVLLSDARLLERTPVVPTSGEGLPMAQFDKDDVEDARAAQARRPGCADAVGDGLRGRRGRAGHGRAARPRRPAVPAGDPATYELISSAETLGCFQIESPGQRDLVGRLQPATFHDLVVDISLFRPGPVAADMVRPFIEARHGRAPARLPASRPGGRAERDLRRGRLPRAGHPDDPRA